MIYAIIAACISTNITMHYNGKPNCYKKPIILDDKMYMQFRVGG